MGRKGLVPIELIFSFIIECSSLIARLGVLGLIEIKRGFEGVGYFYFVRCLRGRMKFKRGHLTLA